MLVLLLGHCDFDRETDVTIRLGRQIRIVVFNIAANILRSQAGLQ